MDAFARAACNVLLQSELLKVQNLHEIIMTLEKRQERERLLVREHGTIEVASMDASIIERAVKRLKISGMIQELLLVDVRFCYSHQTCMSKFSKLQYLL